MTPTDTDTDPTIAGDLAASLRRVLDNLNIFISEHPDPGVEALGAVWEAAHILGRVGGETATAPSKPTEYLYGLPGAERAFDSPGACYEAEIDWDDDASDRAWTIEKWTAAPASRDLPSVDYTIEWVVEHATQETTEDGAKSWEDDGKWDDVKAAFAAALDLLASHVDYKLCDQRVGTHTVTWDDNGEPLLDGQPMYGTAVAR